MLTDSRFLIGVIAGVALTWAFHHWMPGKAGMTHGMGKGGSY